MGELQDYNYALHETETLGKMMGEPMDSASLSYWTCSLLVMSLPLYSSWRGFRALFTSVLVDGITIPGTEKEQI